MLACLTAAALALAAHAPELTVDGSTRSPVVDPDRVAQALLDVRHAYDADLDRLTSAAEAYAARAAAAAITTTTTITTTIAPAELDTLRAGHREARRRYKAVEWLLAHRDEEVVRKSINGAPLPSLEQKVADVTVLEPEGFQPAEELLYGTDTLGAASAKTLADLTGAMAAELARVARYQHVQTLTHAQVWAAARFGLIRVFTLGVTGFDTPGSADALLESAVALQAIRDGIAGYLPALRPELRRSIEAGFATGLALLHASDFDAFDRGAFYRASIRPLYGELLEAQRAIGIETPLEAGGAPLPHNYASSDLFADDFLNDYVFAGQPADDPLFSRKRALGERLFFDAGLSASGELSCASCHDPARAFTDGRAKSLGADGLPLRRNAPTLVGAIFAERYFADMREPSLARQIRHVIQDEHEFATDYLTLVAQLGADPSYRVAFDSAYAEVAPAYRLSAFSLGDALASYVRTLHGNDSPVDRYLRGETDDLAPDVRRGMNLFMGKAACATCHFAPTFAGLVPPYYRESETEVLGTPAVWPFAPGEVIQDTAFAKTLQLDADLGRIGSGRPLDNAPFYAFSFKTPTVRNVALTAPYMHNGAIATLEQVVDFYQRGGGAGVGLAVPHQTLPFDSLELTARDRADLVAFMEALGGE